MRALHAWLAYHSPAMAERVIAADPFGLLRYGETGDLSPAQADALFDALSHLAEEDPYFRASDWDAATATGLMIAPLAARIEAVIGSPASNSHLRSLLIEAVRGTELVQALGPALEAVMFDEERFYREREDAANALLQDRDAEWWRSRDRLAAIIGPELMRYGIQRITEADMPMTKRVDLAFARGPLQLPLEVKGQWHADVWDAATGQLDLQYLIDWRSEQRGVYCVLWFGDLPSATNRRLKAHPDGMTAPADADAMRALLVERIPVSRRPLIEVVVLDLTAGTPA